MNHYARIEELRRLIGAYDKLAEATISREDAQAELDELMAWNDWLLEEQRWRQRVSNWLAEERRWLLNQNIFDEPIVAAARDGWETIRQYVPRLDGVADFTSLPDVLQHRYAAFAAAVMGELPPPEELWQRVQRPWDEALASGPW